MSTLVFAAFAGATSAAPAKDVDVAVGDVPKDFKVRELEQSFVKRFEMITSASTSPTSNTTCSSARGPTTGPSLGPMTWHVDTAREYQRNMLLPFIDEHLRGGPHVELARVNVYNSGEKRWQKFNTWPTACDKGCATPLKPLYVSGNFSLSFDAPTGAQGGDSYLSDPAKPVPFLPRPIVDPFVELGGGSLGGPYEPWSKWLVWDQRFVEGRPDVLAYTTPVLTEAVRVQGIPIADIRAMTVGSGATVHCLL